MSQRVTELHSIMPIGNIPSVMKLGILSHERVSQLGHQDISLSDVQDRRDRKSVPGGLRLHQYANLYFCARNPMMYKRKEQRDGLCVLRISKNVLNLPEVVLADQNAASDYVSFHKSPQGLRCINFDLVFATFWTDSNIIQQWQKTSIKCAEVLVPNCITVDYIEGAYVANSTAQSNLQNAGFNKTITLNPNMFFM